MDEEKQQKKKGSIFYRIGITLITISLFIWIIPIVVPFLSISGGLKASLIGGAVLIAEILFWVGAVLAGKEVATRIRGRSEEHTSELQSRGHLVCRLLLEKKKTKKMS